MAIRVLKDLVRGRGPCLIFLCESWVMLKNMSKTSQLSWVLIGDFNDILDHSEKRGGLPHPQRFINGFREALMESNLFDMGLFGSQFSWEKSRGTTNSKRNWIEGWLRGRVLTCSEKQRCGRWKLLLQITSPCIWI